MKIFERVQHELEVTVRYPWGKMNKGDEFIFPKEINMRSARMSARKASDRYGTNFIVARMGNRIVCRRQEGMSEEMPRGRIPKYPWRTMEKGDVFEMDTDNFTSARAFAYKMSAELGRVFRAKRTKDGIKVKRIK